MDITIDNLFAFLIMFALVVAFVSFVIPSTYLPFTTTEEHQLEDIAGGVMDKLLLTTGYPANWGNDITVPGSALTAFGLRKEGGEPYELDVNKILRICNSSTFAVPSALYVDPADTAQLLGLNGSVKYSFSIQISPALDITVESVSYYILKGNSGKNNYQVPSVIKLAVKNSEGRPASNADVSVIYLLMNVRTKAGQEDIAYMNYTCFTKVTDWSGQCTMNFTSFLEAVEAELKQAKSDLAKTSVALTVFAEYYGIRSTSSFPMDEVLTVLTGSIVDNYLIIDFPVDTLPNGARHMLNMCALGVPPLYIYLDYLHNETNGQAGMVINAGAKKHRVYALGQDIDEDVSFIYLPVKYQGNYYTVVIMRPPPLVAYQSGVPGGMKTSVLRKLVRIGPWHYVFTIAVWRGAEF
jgi:hypothetical protein